MARLFKDGAGTTYDAAIAKFFSVPFGETAVGVPNPGGAYEPFNFVTTDALKQKADMTAAANAFDCGECHVGGAAMDYLPGSRVPLRQIETSASVPGGPLAGKVTAFNYFIDQYDVDGDNVKFEAQHIDYTQTGTVEMDCFICHLDGYKFADRKAALRKARFDATRPVGAGIATPRTDILWGQPGYGTAVVYDTSKVVPADGGGYKLAISVASSITALPPTDNCSSCHFDVHAVDWKKRGDSLEGDVHANIGCMGCHERKDKANTTIGTSGDFVNGTDKALLSMCDPAKGGASPYDALASQLDDKNFKDCAGCHSAGAKTYQTFGAPDPASVHAAKGITLPLLTGGKNHLDSISCEACHVKKNAYVTGGSFVDGSGVDHEGRVADHEHHDPAGQANRVAMAWSNDSKLHPVNLHTSFFIRSKNDRTFDMNADGRAAGVDGILQTHMAEVTGWNEVNALLHDGVVTTGEIGALFTSIQSRFGDTSTASNNLNGLVAPGGSGFNGIYPKLSFMTVPFKNSHNIAPATQAWGANGCNDCHGAGKGFYNGLYNFNAGYNIGWDKATQMTPMTKVNGSSQTTYSHPNLKDQHTGRSIAVDTVSSTGFRTDVDRSEFLYESSFLTLNTAWQSEIVGAAIAFPAAPATFGGSLLKIAVNNGQTRTFQAGSNPADVAGLITAFGTFATAFEFDITGPNANGGITITAKPGYQIKLTANTDGANYGLLASQFVSKPRTPADTAAFAAVDVGGDGVATTRSEWVNYLNAITFTPPAEPVADIATIAGVSPDEDNSDGLTPVNVVINTPVVLVSANNETGMTYTWSFSDGQAAVAGASQSVTFTKTGVWNVTLTVKNVAGVTTSTYAKVNVTQPPSQIVIADMGDSGLTTTVSFDLSTITAPYTRLYIIWGDGVKQWVTTTGAAMNVPHNFKRYAMYKDPATGFYNYKMSVYLYNGAVVVDKPASATITVGD